VRIREEITMRNLKNIRKNVTSALEELGAELGKLRKKD
jgi:hypothetical protein